MSDEVKEAYSPELAGVIAGESAICWVHPDAGLLYRGIRHSRACETVEFRGGNMAAPAR